jgi:hypothetical protein
MRTRIYNAPPRGCLTMSGDLLLCKTNSCFSWNFYMSQFACSFAMMRRNENIALQLVAGARNRANQEIKDYGHSRS